MSRRRGVVVFLLVSSFLSASIVSNPAAAQDQQQPDLSGIWINDDGKKVQIKQAGRGVGATLRATFVSGGDCPAGGTRDYFFQGVLGEGDSITGTMLDCAADNRLVTDCTSLNIRPVIPETFHGEIILSPAALTSGVITDPDMINGKIYIKGIRHGIEAGHFVNCAYDSRWDAEGRLRLIRDQCDALRKAEEEYKRWKDVQKDLDELAEKLDEESRKSYEEESELFKDQFLLDPLKEPAQETGHGLYELWAEKKLIEHWEAEGLGEKAAEALGKQGAEKIGAVLGIASIINMLGEMTLTIDKMLDKGKEADAYAKQALKNRNAALNAIEKAEEANRKVDVLKQFCSETRGQPPSDENIKRKAEADRKAAEELVQSWQRVGGDYVDANGHFHAAVFAFEEALEIVRRAQDGSSLGTASRFLFAAWKWRLTYSQGQPATGKLSEEQIARFNQTMERGFVDLAKAYGSLHQIGGQLEHIGAIRSKQEMAAQVLEIMRTAQKYATLNPDRTWHRTALRPFLFTAFGVQYGVAAENSHAASTASSRSLTEAAQGVEQVQQRLVALHQ